VNPERPNEAEAKQIVERVMGIQLEHADINGGVDYKSTDGTVALEVATVTNGEKKRTRDALSKSAEECSLTPKLQNCWMVFASDTQRQMKTFAQRVQSAMAELELAGVTYIDEQAAAEHVIDKGELSHIYKSLLDVGVEGAVPLDSNRPEDPNHVHCILVSTGSGGSAHGSDESLGRLMEALNEKTDNPSKLSESGAEQGHLFVWLDDDTSYNIALPLIRESPSEADGGWGLPTTNPQLDPTITYLWVVHARSRLGWLWDGESWQKLRDL
jgi:hypothetical protein